MIGAAAWQVSLANAIGFVLHAGKQRARYCAEARFMQAYRSHIDENYKIRIEIYD